MQGTIQLFISHISQKKMNQHVLSRKGNNILNLTFFAQTIFCSVKVKQKYFQTPQDPVHMPRFLSKKAFWACAPIKPGDHKDDMEALKRSPGLAVHLTWATGPSWRALWWEETSLWWPRSRQRGLQRGRHDGKSTCSHGYSRNWDSSLNKKS